MSNLAVAEPLGATDSAALEGEQRHPRHIQIVSTRAQRRARPKVSYALITVGGVFALFIAQLLLSIVVAEGAYEISELRAEQRELTRTEQALGEQLEVLQSPQNLATEAESLGMVVNDLTPMFLRLSDGKVLGGAAASAEGGALLENGSLVPNALLSGLPAESAPKAASDAAPADTAPRGEPQAGAPAVSAGETSVASAPGSNSIPSPVTR